MDQNSQAEPNVQQAVPFFNVTDMERSLQFYVNGLGFKMKKHWEVDGRTRWCWLELDRVAVMLQEFTTEALATKAPDGKLGVGVAISFQCRDALAFYRNVRERVEASIPFVGNGMWFTSISDPDGYILEFESPTDEPEDTEYDEGQ